MNYDASFKVRCDQALADAIKAAAAAASMKSSEWLREAVFTSLSLDRAAEQLDTESK